MKPWSSCLMAVVMACGVGAVHAAKTVEVARVTLSFNEDAWQASEEMPFRRDLVSAQGTVPGAAKVLSLRGEDGEALALMYVAATWGKPQVYNRYIACPVDNRLYVRELNVNKNENVRCLLFGGPYESAGMLKGLLPSLGNAGTSADLKPTRTAFFMKLWLTANGGVNIYIEGLFAPGFAGLADGKPVGEAPPSLRPGTAAWADAMAESALKALTSFSGALPVPALVFEATAK